MECELVSRSIRGGVASAATEGIRTQAASNSNSTRALDMCVGCAIMVVIRILALHWEDGSLAYKGES
jgi:hypothetical protein